MKISRRERERLHDLTQWKAKAHQGTPYPCTQEDLDEYWKLSRPNRRPKIGGYVMSKDSLFESAFLCYACVTCFHRAREILMSLYTSGFGLKKVDLNIVYRMMAAYQIVRHNRLGKEPSPEEVDAIERLRDCLKIIKAWGPDVVLKAFKDLDTVFFKGRLFGNSLVRWRDDEGCQRFGACEFLGVTSPSRPDEDRQVQITLNAEHIFFGSKEPFDQMWTTMLHEMVHAHEVIMCGWIPDTRHDRRVGNMRGHGIYFCTCIKAVHKRAMKLFGLRAIGEIESFPIDALPKAELQRFEEFVIEKKRRRERQDGWDIYHQDDLRHGRERR